MAAACLAMLSARRTLQGSADLLRGGETQVAGSGWRAFTLVDRAERLATINARIASTLPSRCLACPSWRSPWASNT